MTKPKLLIIHHGALGDVVMTFPAIIRLKRSFGRIDGLFQGTLGSLAADLDVIDNWFTLDSALFAPLYSEPVDHKLKNMLRIYDSVILFSHSRLLQETISNMSSRKVYLIRPRPDVDQNIHVTRHICTGLVRHGLIEAHSPDIVAVLTADVYRSGKDRGKDPVRVLIHPGSGSKKKNWEVTNFVKVSKILAADGLQPEFVLGPAEYDLAKHLSARSGPIRAVHMVDDLERLVDLLAAADGFIGNDSGVGHLAAYLGLFTVAVFGPSDPRRWRPVGRAVTVVRPDLRCCPCFETGNSDCRSMECLTATSPQMVANAFYRLVVTGQKPLSKGLQS